MSYGHVKFLVVFPLSNSATFVMHLEAVALLTARIVAVESITAPVAKKFNAIKSCKYPGTEQFLCVAGSSRGAYLSIR